MKPYLDVLIILESIQYCLEKFTVQDTSFVKHLQRQVWWSEYIDIKLYIFMNIINYENFGQGKLDISSSNFDFCLNFSSLTIRCTKYLFMIFYLYIFIELDFSSLMINIHIIYAESSSTSYLMRPIFLEINWCIFK